jgi:ubiquinone/menaquinone biosynthesis C-methylase UbiE
MSGGSDAERSGTWNSIYAAGRQLNRYPFDVVVSFVFANAPQKPRAATRILEVGCGAGNNLWFAAREGFQVMGTDASEVAIEHARRRFATEGLSGEFHVLPFGALPYADESVDLAIDRGALTCTTRSNARAAIEELWRVLVPGGRFLCTPFSSRDTGAACGTPLEDGLLAGFTHGYHSTTGAPACFYDEHQLRALFSSRPWKLRSVVHCEFAEVDGADVNAEWRVIAEKA